MILPSDDDSTPENRPRPRKPEPSPDPFAEDGDDESEEKFPWEGSGIWSPESDIEESQFLPSSDWREELMRELVDSMEQLENFPDPDSEYDPPDPPDLYAFFSQLLAMGQDLKSLAKLPQNARGISSKLAVQLGLIAGELKASGNDDLAARLLALIDEENEA